jgi:HEAT repeat protein
LESLSTREDPATRERALEIMKDLIEEAKPRVVQEEVMSMTLNLLNGEWFTSKMSGLTIAIFLISKDIRADNKQKLIDEIVKCSRDTIFHVRKSVAASLASLVDLIPIIPEQTIIKMAKDLVTDVSDVVRSDCVEGMIKFCTKVESMETLIDKLLPLVLKGFEDTSWRIRKQWVESIERIFKIIENSDEAKEQMWVGYLRSLDDNDGQVKEAAINMMNKLIQFIPNDKFRDDVVPKIEKLYKDNSTRVRKAIAENALEL